VNDRRFGDYSLSNDRERVDLDVVVGFLSTSYWAEGRTHATQEVANARSRCYSVFDGDGAQVAFARAVTDDATFAYVADVFVVPEHRGRGVATFMLRGLLDDLGPVTRTMLGTRDAHALYASVGFAPVAAPERWMERLSH
jgi:predicted GNAT family acetyltransferase